MSNKYNIAIVGATGNVGREIIQILEDNLAHQFLAKPLYPKTKLIVDVDLENNVIVNVNYDHVDPKLLREEETIKDN